MIYWPRKCHVSPPKLTISTKFEDGMTIHYVVIMFAADMLHDLDLLTLDKGHTS